ncbi:MAG TPA: ammonium transporter [Candidatus Binatia bacterium]|nr:ammonium transporter [Candidatus Binatia bacterium]
MKTRNQWSGAGVPWLAFVLAGGVVLGLAATGHAAEAAKVDSGDNAWMLTSAALVLMMTAPGLALFYGGLVRSKNVLNLLMQSFIMIALISVQWVLWGYTLAFGPDHHHLFGGLDWLGLSGVGADPNADYAPTIPHQTFMIYQCMFAVITPALITGAFAERMRFSAFLLFSLLWATFVYDPLAHMVWGTGGLLGKVWGALDFAGGTVVHISSGTSALVCALVIGKRLGYGSDPMPPHNLPFVLAGAALLWFGWFGFNAGSALAANGLATSAFVATNTATAAAALAWMTAEWLGRGKPTMLGAASGAVAGLVAVTPASGYVAPLPALVIGAVAGGLCYGACNLKPRLGWYDDALDVVGVHGVGGTWGAIATGLWASAAVNPDVFAPKGPAPSQGLFITGEWGLLKTQVAAVLLTYLIAVVGSIVCLLVTSAVTGGLRVTEDDEFTGLDLSQHSENAYVFGSAGYESALGGMHAAPAATQRVGVAAKVME